jgi:hypothetical protein
MFMNLEFGQWCLEVALTEIDPTNETSIVCGLTATDGIPRAHAIIGFLFGVQKMVMVGRRDGRTEVIGITVNLGDTGVTICPPFSV